MLADRFSLRSVFGLCAVALVAAGMAVVPAGADPAAAQELPSGKAVADGAALKPQTDIARDVVDPDTGRVLRPDLVEPVSPVPFGAAPEQTPATLSDDLPVVVPYTGERGFVAGESVVVDDMLSPTRVAFANPDGGPLQGVCN